MQLSVLTAEKELFSGDVQIISLPGIDGSFQILERHAPMVSALTQGVVFLKTTDGSTKELPITKGFVEVLDNKVSLLIEGE